MDRKHITFRIVDQNNGYYARLFDGDEMVASARIDDDGYINYFRSLRPNCGFGSALMREIVGFFTKEKKSLSLYVLPENELAIRLYLRFGFLIERYVADGVFWGYIKMVKL